MSPVVDRKARLWELFKREFSDQGDLRERLSALEEAPDQLAERVTMFRLSVRNCDLPLVDLVAVLYGREGSPWSFGAGPGSDRCRNVSNSSQCWFSRHAASSGVRSLPQRATMTARSKLNHESA